MRTPKRLFRQCRGAIAVAFFFSGCINLLMLATPLYTLQIFERVIPTASVETLVFLTSIVVAALLTLAMLEIMRDRVVIRMGHWLDMELSSFVVGEALKSNALNSKLEEGAKAATLLRSILSGPTVNSVFDVPWTPLFMVALFMLHPYMGVITLIAVVSLLSSAVLQAWISSDRYGEMSGSYRSAESLRQAIGRDTGLMVGLGLAKGFQARWPQLNGAQLANSLAFAEHSGMIKSFARFVRLAAQAATLGVGALLVVGNTFGPGELIASSILMGRALAPMEQSVTSLKWIRSAWDALTKLRAIERAMPAEPANLGALGDDDGVAAPGRIRLADATFCYPGRRLPTLRSVDLDIAAGETIAIVGPNGSGKSTLVRLLSGQCQPTNGVAELDGLSISAWQLHSSASRIGYMPELPHLYEGTVQQNIARFTDASLLSSAHAATLAGVHHLLSALPDGYETVIHDNGSPLSLEECRAVAFARALHGKPDIVVLDSPETGIARRRELALIRTLHELKDRGTTLIFATQRPELLTVADRIVVLNDGMVETTGPRQDVLAGLTNRPVAQITDKEEQKVS